jgi:predicted phosphodiesterase
MRLLIISDLHIGMNANTKDLYPYPGSEHKDEKLVSSFMESAKEYQKKHGKFDFLIIPGDITHQANLIEFEYGSNFIKNVMTELNVPEKRIIFVPGNHDVDWSVMEGKTIYENEKKLRSSHKYNTLKDKSHIFSKLSSAELTIPPFFKKWEYDDIIFFGYNSSWHDDSINDKHYGLIEIEHIEKLKQEIEKTEIENKLKFFIVHHHVYQYPNLHPKWIDISCMQNAQSLIELLSEFSFNFIIHGHRHLPNFFSTNINSFPTINLLCAGSYSCVIPTEIAGSIGNLFHIIEIDDLKNCKGRIISKTYDPTKYKWVESTTNRGIEYESAFGNETTYDKLLEQCGIIVSEIASGGFIEFKELGESIPDLKYLQNLDKTKLLNDLESKFNLHKSIAANHEIILIKKPK